MTHTTTCYRHRKTGKMYNLLDVALDCTNARGRGGAKVAVYRRAEGVGGYRDKTLYVRDYEEFRQKFEPVAVLTDSM